MTGDRALEECVGPLGLLGSTKSEEINLHDALRVLSQFFGSWGM